MKYQLSSMSVLSYSFVHSALNTTITWRLDPEEDEARLSLELKGFDLDLPLGKTAFHGMTMNGPS